MLTELAKLERMNINLVRDNLRVELVFLCPGGKRRVFARMLTPEEAGGWQHAVLSRTEPGAGHCVIKVDDEDDVTEVSDDPSNRGWFVLRVTAGWSPPPVPRRVRALAFLNKRRHGIQPPLDPAAAGWTDKDIIDEAVLKGWRG